MQKVLILAYFYPPCNLTAARRPYSWARHFSKSGYYPIIITRNWDIDIKKPMDAYRKSGTKIIHEKHETHEVYFLPYHPNFRDRIYIAFGESKATWIRKFLTYCELIFQNFLNHITQTNNIYRFATKLLNENQDINKLIITGNPFIMFKFGYLLNKKFKIKWIADYRDDWNTQELISKSSLPQRLLHRIESYYEKKWVNTASRITTISNLYVNKISAFVDVAGENIINGYEEQMLDSNIVPFKDFTIVYNGTLYPIQPIEIFLSALKKLIDNHTSANIKLYLPGLSFDTKQEKRVRNEMTNYEDNIIITDRIPKEETIKIQQKAHLLLMISYGNIKGIPSSKLYEYISFRKPVLVCPTDNDIIEETLTKTGLGFFANNEEEAFLLLEKFYKEFSDSLPSIIAPNEEEIKKLSRKHQAEKLVNVLNKI